MNHIYRLVWNPTQQALVAVSESATGRGKSSCGSALVGALLGSVLLAGVSAAMAAGPSTPPPNTLPAGAQVTAGAATISSAANTLTVNQSSQRAAINWQSFSIGANGTVNFVQPNAAAVTLNRVVGNEQSVIAGALNANGQVFLLNSNGVLFTGGAQVNVGGIVASTLNLSDADFMAGRSTFTASSGAGSVINFGNINAADGGYVALLGNQASNQGVITARLGTAALAAGDRISLNFNGNSLMGVTIDQGTLNALVENKQAIRADGGLVTLTAKGLDTVLNSQVNNTGEIRAQTIANREGKIYLLADMSGGTVNVGGTLDASAPNGGNGGFVETSAAHVEMVSGRRVTTFAPNGQTGTWLIDPNDYTIAASGGNITGTQLGTDLATNNVSITTATQGTTGGNGDIFVNDAVSWSSNNTLTLTAERNIKFNQNITATGTGGKLALEYGQGAVAASNTADYDIAKNITVDLKDGQNFSTRLGSDGSTAAYTVISSATDVQNMNNGLNGRYALGANVNLASISNFTPVGNAGVTSSLQFVGMFAGLGHAVSNLTVDSTANANTYSSGLFGDVRYAAIRDVRIVGASVTNNKLEVAVGALVGFARDSQIKNVDVSASTLTAIPTITGLTALQAWNEKPNVGGLAGWLRDSVLTNSSANTVVVSTGSSGGLVGTIQGGATASVRSSYSGGQVTGALIAGGLISEYIADGSTISDVYSTANATVTQATNYLGAAPVGGLIGRFGSGGGSTITINNAYASGLVSGPAGAALGGLLGNMYFAGAGAVLNNLFFDTQTTGQSVGIGLNTGGSVVGAVPTGIANANAYTQASYTGFDFANNWFMVDGYTRPFLRMEATRAISNAHQLQLMSMNLGGNYALLNNINLAPSLTNKSEMWKDNSSSVNYSAYKGSWSPIGDAAIKFTGKFDGLGHTVDHLAFIDPSGVVVGNIGFFGYVNNATVQNIGLTNVDVNTLRDEIGGLIGNAIGSTTIKNSYTTGSITGGTHVGGLVGQFDGASRSTAIIQDSYSTATVNGITEVGGLAGLLFTATASNNYATGNVTSTGMAGGLFAYSVDSDISKSYASGNVGTTNSSLVNIGAGGLIGWSENDLIANTYATGNVAGTNRVGGLVGAIWDGGNSRSGIATSWASGTVTGTTNKGGLVGSVELGTPVFTNNFWDTQTSGMNASAGGAGVTGKTTAEMKTLTTFSGTSPAWDVVFDPSLSGVYPQLRWATNGLTAGSSVWVMGPASVVTPPGVPPVVTPPAGPSTGGGSTSADNLASAIANAINTPLNIAPPVNPFAAGSNSGGTGGSLGSPSSFSNVFNAPTFVDAAFGNGARLAVVSSPKANEPTQAVSLSQARSMMKSGAGNGTGAGDIAPDVRVPVSRNSLADIVNGGVKLPDGVEQELFVVKAN